MRIAVFQQFADGVVDIPVEHHLPRLATYVVDRQERMLAYCLECRLAGVSTQLDGIHDSQSAEVGRGESLVNDESDCRLKRTEHRRLSVAVCAAEMQSEFLSVPCQELRYVSDFLREVGILGESAPPAHHLGFVGRREQPCALLRSNPEPKTRLSSLSRK